MYMWALTNKRPFLEKDEKLGCMKRCLVTLQRDERYRRTGKYDE